MTDAEFFARLQAWMRQPRTTLSEWARWKIDGLLLIDAIRHDGHRLDGSASLSRRSPAHVIAAQIRTDKTNQCMNVACIVGHYGPRHGGAMMSDEIQHYLTGVLRLTYKPVNSRMGRLREARLLAAIRIDGSPWFDDLDNPTDFQCRLTRARRPAALHQLTPSGQAAVQTYRALALWTPPV